MVLLGIAIGGTKCNTVLGIEEEGGLRILGQKTVATREHPDPYEILEVLCGFGDELIEEHGCGKPAAVGIACGSPMDNVRGIVQSPPSLPGWDDIPARDVVQAHFGVPAFLENDANGGALAEWRFGAAKGCDNCLFITFGTGFGAGLILNGRLYTGENDMAGEIGHVRLTRFGPVGYGKTGSSEGYCSGSGIPQIARDLYLEELMQGHKPSLCPSRDLLGTLSAKNVAEAAYAGDPVAKRVFEISGEKLGEILSIIIDILNPRMIVIGSIFARAESLLRPAMERVIERETLPVSRRSCRIVPAALGDAVDQYEALSIASYYMMKN